MDLALGGLKRGVQEELDGTETRPSEWVTGEDPDTDFDAARG